MKRERLRFVFDTEHPPLATHHQKLLVVDDAVAFCGGFDFAANRWDTRRHLPDDPRRRLPTGRPYTAHHDVMMAVDGEAARALGELGRERWLIATGERLPPAPRSLDPWPDAVWPDFRNVRVGIARTEPGWRGRPPVREIERLYLEAIAAAREVIYLENQYLASHGLADAIAVRLREPDGPEVVIVTPKRAPSWVEQVAMDNARTEIAHRLMAADRYNRFRLFAAVGHGCEIVIHSKLMIADDRFLRIGSANLANRSMGVDTECDLALEAEGSAREVRAGILRFRDGLAAEHLGVTAETFARAVALRGGFIGGIEALNGTTERRLALFPKPMLRWIQRIEHNALSDPARPLPSLRARPRLLGGVLLALAGLGAAYAVRRRRGRGGPGRNDEGLREPRVGSGFRRGLRQEAAGSRQAPSGVRQSPGPCDASGSAAPPRGASRAFHLRRPRPAAGPGRDARPGVVDRHPAGAGGRSRALGDR